MSERLCEICDTFFEIDGGKHVCRKCRRHAKIGRAVEAMPDGQFILHQECAGKQVWQHYTGLCCECGFNLQAPTPLDALRAAGLAKEE